MSLLKVAYYSKSSGSPVRTSSPVEDKKTVSYLATRLDGQQLYSLPLMIISYLLQSEEESLIPKSDEEDGDVDVFSARSNSPGEKKSTSSIGGASFNFINSIIGSGIIGAAC